MRLGFGVGIAYGFATLGTIGFEGRFDYAAIGTVSNVASRLCDEARPGQILISPRVMMAVEDAVTVEPVGDFTLKGIGRPVAAYNVLSAVSSKNQPSMRMSAFGAKADIAVSHAQMTVRCGSFPTDSLPSSRSPKFAVALPRAQVLYL